MTRRLAEKIGNRITIKNVEFGEGKYGTYAILTLGDGRKYRTWSEFVIKKLRRDMHVKRGETVTGFLKSWHSTWGRTYYSLEEIRAER